MQRRNKQVDNSSTGYIQKNPILPTTTINGKATTTTTTYMKNNHKKKKVNTVTCLVQTIIILLVATSAMMIYIAVRKKGGFGMKKNNVLQNNNNSHNNIIINKNNNNNMIMIPNVNENNNIGNKNILDHHDITKPDHHHRIKADDMMEEIGIGLDDPSHFFEHVDDENKGEEEEEEEENNHNDNAVPTLTRKRRTTEEANAYMAKQESFSVDGEKALKKELLTLYELQSKGLEKLSPIVTRWIGDKNENGEKMKYWVPASTTSDEERQAWEVSVEKMKEEMRTTDVVLFPKLHTEKEIEHVKKIKGDQAPQQSKGKSEKPIVPSSSSKSYPDPRPEGTHVVLKPTFGAHRQNVDAVFALAEGYDLNIYLLFIESLKETGFNGDLVLSVSELGSLKPGVEEYLSSNQLSDGQTGVNVVAYTVSWKCFTDNGEVAAGANQGIRKCELVGMYGEDADEHIVPDPHEPRPVATARFELYWAWSQHYNKENWIMLIDSRDAHFQLNPFEGLPRDIEGDNGLLYFFGENAEVSNISKSSFNSRWLKTAYGMDKVQPFFDKPIICSGSTMGQQVALEPYLRAMIAQFDETKCKLKGCDQGFHNYLYYSNSLSSLEGVKEVQIFEQGTGIINNLGVLRVKPLREWGLLDENNTVLNWDKSVSAVAHQFDRDDELNKHLKEVRKEYEGKFHTKARLLSHGVENQKVNQSENDAFGMPLPSGTHVILEPTFGKHRKHVDAIFGLAEGYDIRTYLMFIESLKATGFSGDLVLSVSELGSLKPGVEEYLRSHHKDDNEDGLNVVVYTITWNCFNADGSPADGAKEGIRMCNLVGMYGNDTDNEAIPDPREARPVATARFELYWAWSQQYDKHNWIMLIDTRDALFQLNPFEGLNHDKEVSHDDGLLYFFAENAEVSNISKSSFNSRWLKTAYGMDKVQPFFDKPIICSGSTMGQQVALEPYLRAMIAQFDETKCKLKGCDQGFHNYLYYSKALSNVKGIREVIEFEQGTGIINNLGVLRVKPLREWGLLDENNTVLNWDKSVSAVAHQYDRDEELNKHYKAIRKDYTDKFWASKK